MFQKRIVQRWREINSVDAGTPEIINDEMLKPNRTLTLKAKPVGLGVAGVFVIFWLMSNFSILATAEPKNPAIQNSNSQILRQLVLELDKARNTAIAFRDAGLITQYANELSPIYVFDRKLIQSMIKNDIVIEGVEYTVLSVEQISLRRSGTSEFMRLSVRDTRSGYEQTIRGKSSKVAARAEGMWELELFRQSGSQKWTLWSAQEVRELQP